MDRNFKNIDQTSLAEIEKRLCPAVVREIAIYKQENEYEE